MAPEWPSSAGARAWAIYCQGVEAPWTLAIAQKYTRRNTNNKKNTGDDAKHREDEAYTQGIGGQGTRQKPLGTGRDWAADQGNKRGEWA